MSNPNACKPEPCCKPTCGNNGYLLIIVLYILLVIILGSVCY